MNISVLIQCKECGQELTADQDTDRHGAWYIEAEPCDQCMEAAADEAHIEGIEEGIEDGFEEGFKEGKGKQNA